LNNFSFLFKGGPSSEASLLSFYEFDGILEPYSLEEGAPRLLNCSSDLFIPVNTTSRFLITSTDVIHSFALPSLAIKVDAIPGRINQLFTNPSRVGSFYGQCSEICGANHSFMPISIKVCALEDYDKVTSSYLLNLLSEKEGILFLSFSY